ncbi:MAG: hypothetical protein J6A04_07240 [Clostridia bacterium]|nr:hypothetical protein [Clostridia bacterium]
MTNFKKVCLVMLVVILLGTTAVFATSDTIMITQQNTVIGGNVIENTTNTTNTVNNTIATVIGTGNTSTYNNTTNLPQTGADDYAVLAVIAVFAVSAVYAYKKIRDYKNI